MIITAVIEKSTGGFFLWIQGNCHGFFETNEDVFRYIEQWDLNFHTIEWK